MTPPATDETDPEPDTDILPVAIQINRVGKTIQLPLKQAILLAPCGYPVC
ncbi:MAG: hypothetical protein ACLTXL_12660 [Clostridia bacterium]